MSGFIRVPADDAGKRVDTVTLTDELVEVHRQKMVVTGGSGTAEVVVVTNAAPAAGDMGLVVRHAGTATVAGTVNVNGGVAISGTAQVAIGTPFTINNISATVTIAGNVNISATPSVILATGTANFGTLNNISATVVIAGVVGLTAGTAVIGDLNAISRTVQVAVGTPFTVNNISATTTVVGVVGLTAGTANIGFINNISATVTVAGNVNVSTMPAVTIAAGQTINNISASVQVATGAVADFNTSADVTQNLPLIGIAQSAAGGAVAWGGSVTVANNVNISNTPSVVLAAGTAVFGTLNDISRTVQVAVGTPFTLQGISTTVQVAVGTPFTVNNISATVTVAGNVNISATAAVGIAYVTEKTTGSLVPVGDSANAAIRVNVVAGSSGGVSQVDGTTFSTQAANFVPIGGIFDDVATDTLSENDAGVVRLTTNRGMHVNLRTDGGTKLDDSANSALRVNVVAGGGAGGGTSTADRSTFTPGTTAGTPVQGTYNTTAASISDGEAATVRITLNRAFHVNLRDNSGGEITATNPLSVKVERTSATDAVVLAAGTANFGTLNDISRTVQVAVSTPYTLNNISASVQIATGATADFDISGAAVQNIPLIGIAQSASGGAVAWGGVVNISNTPSVVLAAGTAVFGTLNDISRTVQVAVGTPFTINNISATTIVAGAISLAAGANVIGIINNISATTIVAGVVSLGAGTNNIGIINNISATVTVAGNINISATPSVILAAGTAVFGTLNDISRTVQVAIGTPYIIQGISTTVTTVVSGYTPAVMAASHGPKCVTASTSSNVTLIASPGAGANIYVTQLMVGNFSSTLTRARIGTSASVSTIVQPLAASGGGFVFNFDPPWMLSASEACLCSVKPNVADAFFTVNFFVK